MSSTSCPPPLPGFGLPLNHAPTADKPLFPSALTPGMDDSRHLARLPPFTLRELAMLHFMNHVTDKPDWQVKVFDESIVKKWKKELDVEGGDDERKEGDDTSESAEGEVKHARGEKATKFGDTQDDKEGDGNNEDRGSSAIRDGEDGDKGEGEGDGEDEEEEDEDEEVSFTERMFQYCIDELRYKAELFKKCGYVHVYHGDVVQSDVAIPSELEALLKAAVASLENVPESKKDWHPGSEQQVLDLVHPSLFPLVYGLSKILPDTTINLDDCVKKCGQGEVLPIPPEDNSETFTITKFTRGEDPVHYAAYSRKFQWLPCDVDISGDTPRILSYINNLQPKEHPDLYQAVEQIIAQFIPLWNATLSASWDDIPQRITYRRVEYDEDGWEEYCEKEKPVQGANEDEVDYEDRYFDWESDNKRRFYIQPDVEEPFSPPADDAQNVDLKRDYANEGLQIIVKLANIHLTPEKPTYPGGSWHIEGQLNEHICASAIYYYDCENISSTYLAFRQAVNPDYVHNVAYAQNDNAWIEDIYGLENWQASVQHIGDIETRQGRVVTFPNILQHQVQPFQLDDSTKPGHRKILALFLVDPNMKIISTANVPCQRRDWWGQIMMSDAEGLGKLPLELREKVIQDVEDFPIDLPQAKKLREELMEERRQYVFEYQEANFKSIGISLCEH